MIGSARRSAIGVAFAAVASLAPLSGCGRKGPEAGSGNARSGMVSAPNVTVITPEPRNLVRAFKAPGTVEAYQEVTLYAKTSGYLSRILVDRGDRVRKAQVLAEISIPEMAREREVAGRRRVD